MNRTVRVVALAAAASLVACKGYLDVTNPGPILDSDLFTAEAVPALVVGMSSDLSNDLDELARFSSIAGDESGHGGSYAPEALWVRGIIRPEDVNGLWGSMHSTRFEAESGVDRIKGLANFDYDHSAYAARANMLAGFSDRSLGEFTCYAVFNNGPAQDRVEYFKRAEGYFTEAIRIGAQATPLAAPNDPPSIVSASYAGRASVRAWQGNWTGAVDDATKVPTSFVYYAPYSTNTTKENNSLVPTGFGCSSHFASMAARALPALCSSVAATPMKSPSRITVTPAIFAARDVSADTSFAPKLGGRSTRPNNIPGNF